MSHAVRDLARQGVLTTYVETAADEERRRLRAEIYEITYPVVFSQLTRKLEINRGHFRCSGSVHLLDDDCLDRFHDDMDAVVEDVLQHSRVPIVKLEGWVSRRMRVVTINAYRKRRTTRGALQRPRIPRWLMKKLGEESRLVELAAEMLEFAGVESTAGTELWPIDTWAARRAVADGDFVAARKAVVRDVDAVVAAMRSHPKWYDDYVERPLGRKRAPLLASSRVGPDPAEELAQLSGAYADAEESHLAELAAVAINEIGLRLARADDPRTVVVDVLTSVFGSGVGVADLDRRPGDTQPVHEQIVRALADDSSVDRIVAEVLAILAGPPRSVSEKQ